MTGFDYLVVGGGTAGCIVAARLAEDPAVSVGLVEWGPSDEHEPRARSIRRWAEMLEGEYDLDYRSVPHERGNSGIRQARLRILGGCSTANTMISWRPRVADLREWVDLGAVGWDACAPPAGSANRSLWRRDCGARSSPVRARRRTPTSRPWPAPPTRPSTTSAEPAGWAPPTTRSPCSTRTWRVRGVPGIRFADASVFPTIPSVNPVVTVMLTAERAADLIRQSR
jgi:choline dehydrogenase-like flavoprotein